MPAFSPARLASTAAAPLSANRFSITGVKKSSASPSRPAAIPSAIMFGRPPGMAFAISLIGTSTTRAPVRPTMAGKSPPRGSLITRLCGAASISAPKRWALTQSMPMSRSKCSGGHSTGPLAKRTKAAASPPRICGPTVRVSNPCHPAAHAASSRKLPAVSAPAPPLPRIAMEMLSASGMRASPAE